MEPGLRERKKARTIHHVQEVAVRLFTEKGFDAVTVEQVAADAEVSPSTIYRYFGTKERLLIVDEFDDRALGGIVELLAPGASLPEVVRQAMHLIGDEHFVDERDMTMIRTRMILETPALRAAAGVRIAEITRDLAAELSRVQGYSQPAALAVVASLVGCILAALFTWYEAGGVRTYTSCIDEALDALGEVARP